jgi:hypothetical protein
MQVQYKNTYPLHTYCTTCGDLSVLHNMETDELEPCWACEQTEATDINDKAERV